MTALPQARHCKHCGHGWYPRKNAGKICPVCKRPYSERKAVTRKAGAR